MRTGPLLPALLCLLSLLPLAALAGCGKADPHAAGFANAICPIEGSTIVTDDPMLSVQYKGQKIGFCCPGCPRTFREDPEKYMELMRKDPERYGYKP